ncbi:hypothetical protein ACQ4PT_002522 [Festuca glaucescens]
MADSTAVYTLGHLSINGSAHKQKLAVFWAPFLLVHLGSQDTITGYALEDNKLWPRHLLNLAVQAFGVAYVLYKHIAEIPTSLRLAAGLIFIIGLIKYAERIWALKCATLVSIRSSINNKQRLPNYDELPSRGLMAEECDEEELLLFAQAMLPLCKGAMADSPVALFSFKVRGTGSFASIYEWKNWNWKATSKVVQMELSLMYDIIHTCDTPKDAASSTYLKAIKVLSDYMVFLVAVRPDMIPGLELRSMYDSTVEDLKVICLSMG